MTVELLSQTVRVADHIHNNLRVRLMLAIVTTNVTRGVKKKENTTCRQYNILCVSALSILYNYVRVENKKQTPIRR